MSKRPLYHISDQAIERFIERFNSGLKKKSKVRSLLAAMAINGFEHMVGKNGYNRKCIMSKERQTGRRVFLVAEPNTEGDAWYVVKTVLTQTQACSSFGLVYPKEQDDD